MQGIHHGLGRGCGAVIGGMFVNYFGTTTTFRGYGVICLMVLAAFIFINFYRKEQGFVSNIPTTEDPHQVKYMELIVIKIDSFLQLLEIRNYNHKTIF